MGMFDTVRCEAKHPLGADVSKGQEKQFKCFLETVLIDEQGRLFLQDCEYVDTPEDELPYKDDPNQFMRLCGSIKTVHKGWIPQEHYTGFIDTGEWAAVFYRGQLMGFQKWDNEAEFVEFAPPVIS